MHWLRVLQFQQSWVGIACLFQVMLLLCESCIWEHHWGGWLEVAGPLCLHIVLTQESSVILFQKSSLSFFTWQ